MARIYAAIENADVLIIGTPAYYDGVSAQLKLVIDRSNCLTEMITLADGKVTFKSRLRKKKRGIFIWIADFSRNPEHALATIRLWCKDANVDLVDVLTVTDSDRGEGARNRKELLTKAYEIGASLNR
jgi:multimeric flavodoxin WrbA